MTADAGSAVPTGLRRVVTFAKDNRLMDMSTSAPDKVIYWHRELPPLDAEPMEEHTLEAASMRVRGTIEHRNELWDRCYEDLMMRLRDRLHQEVTRLGGHYAHVLDESFDTRHDDIAGEVWLHGRVTYLLLRRQSEQANP
jgi:hypothetical protein